jgi:hypothetical protein
MLDNWTRLSRGWSATGRPDLFRFLVRTIPRILDGVEQHARELSLSTGGGLGSAARLRAILGESECVRCTPTYALHLAEISAREGLNLARSKIRKILLRANRAGSNLTMNESAPPGMVPGARHYGMTEVGPVAFRNRIGQACCRSSRIPISPKSSTRRPAR